MIVFMLNGWAKSGKDTAAFHLVEKLRFKKVSFADPLKENVANSFNIPLTDMHSQSKKEAPLMQYPVYCKDAFSEQVNTFLFKEFRTPNGLIAGSCFVGDDDKLIGVVNGESYPLYYTPRALCILEGSTKRSADPSYWVTRAISEAKKSGSSCIVIADLRYKNEISAVKLALGPNDKLVTIRINRFDSTPSSDPSENDLNNAEFDYYVQNKTTEEEFLNKILEIGAKEVYG
jgi:hypothetical protein